MITIFVSLFFWFIYLIGWVFYKIFKAIEEQQEYEEAKRNEHKLTSEEIIKWFEWRDNI